MAKTRILVADDHELVRAGVRSVVGEFEQLSIVAEVEDGLALRSALERTKPDCILIDLNMPEFEALESITEIRKQFPDLKILVISVFDDAYYVQGLLEAGVNGYHLKDQPLSDLKLALQRVLEGERWISGPLIAKLVGSSSGSPDKSLLTSRQQEILRLLQEGKDNQSIALEMNLSIKTVENHLTRIYRQLGVSSRLEAVHYINQHPKVLGERTAQSPQPHPTEPREPHELAILLVDDNQRYLQQLQRVLSRIQPNSNLYLANTSFDALQLAKRLQPQLVLVDVVLGNEDGILCARRIKSISNHSRIIMISAYPDREFHRLSIEAGAVAFLDKKDLDARTLRHLVDDLIT